MTEISAILEILDRCKVCRLGMIDGDTVYMVPVNFGYTYEDEKLVLYIHGAKEGHKYDVIAEHPNVGFEMDCEHELVTADIACAYGYRFASIVGNGKAEIVSEPEEKKKGLSVLMRHQTGKDFMFGDKEAESVTVLKVTAESFSGKRKQ